MATVVFCPVMFNLAETTRMIQVARCLDSSVHTPVFMGYEDDYAYLVRQAGFEYLPCEPAWTQAQRNQAIAFDQGRTLRSPFTTALVSDRVEVERKVIRARNARAVVTGSNVTSFISARAEHVPLFFPVPFALTRPQVAQARHQGLVSGSGRIQKGADRLATAAFRWIYNSAPLAPRAFTTVARAHGLAALRTVSSLITADVNLLTEMSWELDGFDLPAGFQRIGPIFAHLDTPMPTIVTRLAEAPAPLVYLGLGSSANRRLSITAAPAMGTLPINVVAPIRHYLHTADTVPPNVHVTDLLPAHRLGGLIDAAVLHGGQGTVQTACATGIPFVGMGLQPEQSWHVRLCAERGNAVALRPADVAKPDFLAAVRRVLDDPAIRSAADEVRRAYAHEDGACAAARIIRDAIET